MRKQLKTIVIWALLVVLFFAIYSSQRSQKPLYRQDFEEFLEDVEHGRVREIAVEDNLITVTLKRAGAQYTTLGVLDKGLTKTLSSHGISVSTGKKEVWYMQLLVNAAPILILLALWIFFMKRMGGGAGYTSLLKSKARLVEEKSAVSFKDVGGCLEAKEVLGDMIDFLNNPKRWTDAGVRQDAACACGGGGNQGALLQRFRLGIRRNVRGCGRGPGARHVRNRA
jgi:cell division protease FtsH